MQDGLYRVITSYFVAGFVIKDNKLIACAPIIRKKFNYYKTIATRVCD